MQGDGRAAFAYNISSFLGSMFQAYKQGSYSEYDIWYIYIIQKNLQEASWPWPLEVNFKGDGKPNFINHPKVITMGEIEIITILYVFMALAFPLIMNHPKQVHPTTLYSTLIDNGNVAFLTPNCMPSLGDVAQSFLFF